MKTENVIKKNQSIKANTYSICPICKNKYLGYPAISRKDNKTNICPKCGFVEAIEIYLKNKKTIF